MTPKQATFVQEYLVDLNATEAAIRAGYSKKTAYSIGCENLTKPEISDAIQKAMSERGMRTQVTADNVVLELARVAFLDHSKIVEIVDGDVKVKDTSELSEDERRAVAEVSQTETLHGGSLRVKTHDKLKALELLGRHLGMFTDKLEVAGKDGGPIDIKSLTDEELERIARGGKANG